MKAVGGKSYSLIVTDRVMQSTILFFRHGNKGGGVHTYYCDRCVTVFVVSTKKKNVAMTASAVCFSDSAF